MFQRFGLSTHIRKKIYHWLWPGRCLLCSARAPAGKDICVACEQSLLRPTWACPRCAAHGAVMGVQDVACGECQKKPPTYAFARAAFRYASPVDKLIQKLKYHSRLDLARVLGTYLADYLLTLDEFPPNVIVPVPLHISRLRERGYNQSLEIARVVAKRLHLPLNWRHARRTRPTAPQTELSREQRRINVRDAFATNNAFVGLRVAVLDDVMTSGHTVDALAKRLLHDGADEVRVWVVARA